MLKIEKSKEPNEWTEYCSTPGAPYDGKQALRESLLKEQGYICAYCMRRIPTRDEKNSETSRIDHILCRTRHTDQELKYKNMVVCCPGAIDNNYHCDKLKGEKDITFNLFNDSFISTISYKTKDGTIESSNMQYNKEMEMILNLNHPLLKKNRQQALIGIIQILNQKKKHWTRYEIQKHLTNWNNKDKEGQLKPYCGIIIWYLKTII